MVRIIGCILQNVNSLKLYCTFTLMEDCTLCSQVIWLQFVLTFLYMGFSKENDRFIIYFVIILLILSK